MGLKIGNIDIPTKFILAPMAGITNEAFRIICKEYGASFVVGEMVSDKAICFKNKKTINMVKVNDLEHPVAIQLFGSDVESMVYENTQGPTTDINYLDDYILQSKLMPYKIMCMKKLLDILGKEELDKIIKEENL